MKYHNIASYHTLNQFVDYKLDSLNKSKASFKSLFELMFSEPNNIIYEYTYGYDIKHVTYLESKNNVISLSKKIVSLNLKSNSVIGIYLDNDITWIETFWAILRSGHRPLLLNTRLDDTSLKEAMDTINCELVVSKRKKFDVSTILYKDLLEKDESDKEVEFGSEILFMSSGTSENVKICAYTAKEIKAVLAQSGAIIKANAKIKRHYNGELKLLAFLPFYHIFGFIAVYTWFSFYARTFVGLNDLAPETIKNTITRHGVTHIFAVPLFYEKTYQAAIKEIKKRGDKTYKKFLKGINVTNKLGNSPLRPLFSKLAFKEVRENLFGDSISFLISGGSAISKDVLTFFNAIGYHLTCGYGMTEIGITSVDLSNNYKALTNASIGKPLSGTEYKINKDNELLVKGTTLASYIISKGKVEVYNGDYFNTHDLMEYKNNRYYFLGRKDDLIVTSNGENLNPNIIEERIRLSDTPNLALISESTNKEAILLIEVSKYLSRDKLTSLDNRVKEKIAINNYQSLISKVVYVKEPFIKGEEFKINRKRLARDYFSNNLSIFDQSKDKKEEQDELLEKVISIIKDNLLVDKVDSSSDLFLDLGASSLDYYAIASNIYDEFEVNIIGEDSKLSLVSDIVKLIKESL